MLHSLTVSLSRSTLSGNHIGLDCFPCFIKKFSVCLYLKVAYFFDFSIFIVTFYCYDSIKAFCLVLIYAIFIADRSIFLRFLWGFWRWSWVCGSRCGRITVSLACERAFSPPRIIPFEGISCTADCIHIRGLADKTLLTTLLCRGKIRACFSRGTAHINSCGFSH